MKYTKLISTLLALLLIAGLFAACGGAKDETQPQATLPTIEAPIGTGVNPADPTGSGQETNPGPTQDPFRETRQLENEGKDLTSSNHGESEAPPEGGKTFETDQRPEETQNSNPTVTEGQPTSTQPGVSVGDDSGEDVVVTESAPSADTDEDLH